jgi:pimeloyl-ACP methyl ester carboxylesterase
VAALADTLDLDRFVAVGYSMGGPIAQLMWHRHPDRVAGLVLCATACHFAPAERRRSAFAYSQLLNVAGRFAPRRVLRRIAEDSLAGAMADPELRSRVMAELSGSDPVTVLQAGAALARFNSADWISGIDVPTAVVVTEQDGLVPAERQLQMAHMIRDATVHRVSGDHSVCVTQPRLFVPALMEACTSVTDRVARSGARDSTPRSE